MQNLASRSLVDEVLQKVNGLKPIADEVGATLAQLAIAWCASNPNVSSVITGATKESQVNSLGCTTLKNCIFTVHIIFTASHFDISSYQNASMFLSI